MGEGSIDIQILAYTCACSCESDCIGVFGFMTSDSSAGSNMAALFNQLLYCKNSWWKCTTKSKY